MKNFKWLLLWVLLFALQVNKAQNQDHPTISGFQISHTAVVQATPSITPYVISQATINLVSADSVSMIHFKILDPANNNSVVYQADYLITTPASINQAGIILFKNDNGTIFISSGQAVALKNYTYHIQTEDSQQNLSPLFFEMQ